MEASKPDPEDPNMPKRWPMQERQRVVQDYFAAPIGKRSSVLEHYGVSKGTFSRWHKPGQAAPAPQPSRTRRDYTLDFTLKVLRDLRESGDSQPTVAARHGLHFTVVSQWSRGRTVNSKKALEMLDAHHVPPAEAGGAVRAKRKGNSVALAVRATADALEKVNAPQQPGTQAAGALIREVLLRLRSLGIHLEHLSVQGDNAEISYTVKEAIDL